MSLHPRAKALLDAAANRHDPSSEDADRVLALLAPKVGAVTALAATTAATAKVGAAAGTVGTASKGLGATVALALSTKVVVAVAVVSAAGGIGAYEVHASRAPSRQDTVKTAVYTPIAARSPRPAAAEVAAAPPVFAAEAPSPLPTVLPLRTAGASPPASDVPQPPPPPVASSRHESALPEEIALIRESELALRQGDGASALAALDAHAQRFPSGVLAPERMAARVFALCALGRVDGARAAARDLGAAYPESVHVARVATTCARAK